MPVKSDATQPVLPSVSPIRLLPSEMIAPRTLGKKEVAVLPVTIVLRRTIGSPRLLLRPPLTKVAEFPLTVQLVSATVPS